MDQIILQIISWTELCANYWTANQCPYTTSTEEVSHHSEIYCTFYWVCGSVLIITHKSIRFTFLSLQLFQVSTRPFLTSDSCPPKWLTLVTLTQVLEWLLGNGCWGIEDTSIFSTVTHDNTWQYTVYLNIHVSNMNWPSIGMLLNCCNTWPMIRWEQNDNSHQCHHSALDYPVTWQLWLK